MNKIELVHNEFILGLLKEETQLNSEFGFSSMFIDKAFGPVRGEFKHDHIGEHQYYTLIFLKNESEVSDLLDLLKNKAKGHKFLFFKSVVEYLTV